MLLVFKGEVINFERYSFRNGLANIESVRAPAVKGRELGPGVGRAAAVAAGSFDFAGQRSQKYFHIWYCGAHLYYCPARAPRPLAGPLRRRMPAFPITRYCLKLADLTGIIVAIGDARSHLGVVSWTRLYLESSH